MHFIPQSSQQPSCCRPPLINQYGNESRGWSTELNCTFVCKLSNNEIREGNICTIQQNTTSHWCYSICKVDSLMVNKPREEAPETRRNYQSKLKFILIANSMVIDLYKVNEWREGRGETDRLGDVYRLIVHALIISGILIEIQLTSLWLLRYCCCLLWPSSIKSLLYYMWAPHFDDGAHQYSKLV